MPTSVAGRVGSGSGSCLWLRVTLSGHDLRLISRSRQQLVLRKLRQVLREHEVHVFNRLALEELQECEAMSVSRKKQETRKNTSKYQGETLTCGR